MEVHQTGDIPDWQAVPKSARNRWQRLAARTHGYITPGNAISVIGALLTIFGFVWLYQGKSGAGMTAVIIGRLGDVLDGYVAHHTGTKSLVGETIDAGADKLVMFVALIVLFSLGAVPAWLAVTLGVQQAVIGALSGYARLKQKAMHPSLVGKYSAVALWTVLSGYTIALVLYDVVPPGVLMVLHILLTGAMLVGFVALGGYLRHVGKAA